MTRDCLEDWPQFMEAGLGSISRELTDAAEDPK